VRWYSSNSQSDNLGKGGSSSEARAMTELIATIAIIVSSVLLFGYWFRYTCLLILSAHTTRDYAGSVATANQLHFLEVQEQIRSNGNADLDQLRASLDRDYAVITYLLKHAAHPSEGQATLERQMLAINYRAMH